MPLAGLVYLQELFTKKKIQAKIVILQEIQELQAGVQCLKVLTGVLPSGT